MQRWSPRRVVSLLLGISVFLGVSLTGAWSGDMAVQAANATPPSHSACLACAKGDGETETLDVCVFLCSVLGNAISPASAAVGSATDLKRHGSFVRLGRNRTLTPEPSPPRPIDLG